MMELSQHARLLLRHILTTKGRHTAVGELIEFSPADGGIVDQKGAARDNAAAITELIRAGLAYLWVVDEWDLLDYIKAHEEVEAIARDLGAELPPRPPPQAPLPVLCIVLEDQEAARDLLGIPPSASPPHEPH